MFAVSEKVVYPGHGVAQINNIIEMIVGGSKTTCYELKFLNKEGTILVPTHQSRAVGMRPLSSVETIQNVFEILSQPAKLAPHDKDEEAYYTNWNKRKKNYQLQLQKGNLAELSEIYRDLRFIETQKELSFGERELLLRVEAFLAEEISLVQKISKERIMEQMRTLCGKNRISLVSSSCGII